MSEFVSRGGRIIGILDAIAILQGAGLTSAEIVDIFDVKPVKVVNQDHPLVKDVASTFNAPCGAAAYFLKKSGEILISPSYRPELAVAFTSGPIIMIGFDYCEIDNNISHLLANAIAFGGPACPPESLELEANKFLTNQKINANALTGTKEQQYCIFVEEGAKLLAIKLESKGNLDLHIRQGKPIERSGSAIIADYSLPSPDGNEFLIIFAPQLKKGPYFIAVENKENSEQEFTLIATPISDIQELKGSAEGQVDPNAGLIPFLRQYLATQGGMLSLTQYKFDVPSGAKSVTIRLEGPSDKTLNLHLRHEKPVEIVADRVAADLLVIGPGGQKGVVLAGTLLKAGRWYIAVKSLQTEKVDFKVVVEIQTESQRLLMVFKREQ